MSAPDPKRKVLIVDDSPDTRIILSSLLESVGAEVTTASDGDECLRHVAAAEASGRPFHLVMMDIRMPNMSGTEAAKQLRVTGYNGMIAACTACSSGFGRRDARGSGIDFYFDKTVVTKKLVAALLEHV